MWWVIYLQFVTSCLTKKVNVLPLIYYTSWSRSDHSSSQTDQRSLFPACIHLKRNRYALPWLFYCRLRLKYLTFRPHKQWCNSAAEVEEIMSHQSSCSRADPTRLWSVYPGGRSRRRTESTMSLPEEAWYWRTKENILVIILLAFNTCYTNMNRHFFMMGLRVMVNVIVD